MPTALPTGAAVNARWTIFDDNLRAEREAIMTGLNWEETSSVRMQELIKYFEEKQAKADAEGIVYDQKVRDALQKMDDDIDRSNFVQERRYHEVLGGQQEISEIRDAEGNITQEGQAYEAPDVLNFQDRFNLIQNDLNQAGKDAGTGYNQTLGYAAALDANRERYEGMVDPDDPESGVRSGGILDRYQARYKAGEDLYDDYGLQMLGGVDAEGNKVRGDVGYRYDQALGRNQANLASRGMNNLTIGSNLDNQAFQQESDERRRVAEGIVGQKGNYLSALSGDVLGAQQGYAQQQLGQANQGLAYGERRAGQAQQMTADPLGVMVGRTDTGPDLGQLTQAWSQWGAGQAPAIGNFQPNTYWNNQSSGGGGGGGGGVQAGIYG